jgi:lipopolysaccharide transport system permease protein
MIVTLANGLADLAAGLRRHRVWRALAGEDITDQHRRTALGPLWLLLNYLAFAATFIFIFHVGDGTPGYAIYAATGLLVWLFIMEVISTSVTLFTREESFIKGTTLPISVYVFRAALQSMIRAAYAAAGWLIVILLAGAHVEPAWLLALLGIGLLVIATPAAITVFAFCGLVFPDSQYIVSNLMRIGMFVTPVFWLDPGTGGVRGVFYHYNPFTYFLEIVRGPIVNGHLPLLALGICAIITLMLWLIGLLLLGRYRREVALLL